MNQSTCAIYQHCQASEYSCQCFKQWTLPQWIKDIHQLRRSLTIIHLFSDFHSVDKLNHQYLIWVKWFCDSVNEFIKMCIWIYMCEILARKHPWNHEGKMLDQILYSITPFSKIIFFNHWKYLCSTHKQISSNFTSRYQWGNYLSLTIFHSLLK